MTTQLLSKLLELAVVVVASCGAIVFFRWYPKSLTILWACVLFFVPIWVGAWVGIYFSAVVLVTLLVIASSKWTGQALSHIDVLLLAFAALLGIGCALGWVSWVQLMVISTGWLVPYAGGRLILTRIEPSWIYSCLAAAAAIAAILGIVEFVTGTNMFIGLGAGDGLHKTWGTLQIRGGMLRVEGAFGHSIAFGAALSMSSAFILVVRWPAWTKLICLLVVSTAVGLSFSRIGIITLGLTLAGSLIFLRRAISRKFRIVVILCFSTLALIGIPQLLQVFGSAGDEATGSAAYRGDLYSLIPDFSALGTSRSWRILPNGEGYYGQFQSIDSELVLTALRFGFVPLLLLLAVLVSALISIGRGNANPASIALAAQIPSLAAVALITQYANLLWFVGGLAVATYSATSSNLPSRRTAENVEITTQKRTS